MGRNYSPPGVSGIRLAPTRGLVGFPGDPGREFTVTAEIAGKGGGKLTVALDQKSVPAEIGATETDGPRTVTLGKVSIAGPEVCTLELEPVKNKWPGFELQRVTLTPVK
jgi:hypothetical protein